MSCQWACGVPPARPPPAAIVKATIIKLHASIVSITGIADLETRRANASPSAGTTRRGLGLLIHPTLVLTTHSTVPSLASIKNATMSFCHDIASSSYAKLKFFPEIFFQTDEELDLTVVSCEIVSSEIETLALDTTKLRRRALRKGRTTFLMGCQDKGPEDVVLLEGTIAGVKRPGQRPKDIFFQTGDVLWVPGSAGFDEFGTFSFMVTSSPLKLQEMANGDKKSSVLEGLFASKYPKQQAISIQVVKDWMEPFWRMHKEEVFQGPQLAVCEAAAFKRPSSQENPSEKQKSVILRGNDGPNTAIANVPIRQLQEATVLESDPSSSEATPLCLSRKSPELTETKPTGTRTIAVETLQEEFEPVIEKRSPKVATEKQRKTRNPSPNAVAPREQRTKEFMGAKKKGSLKKISKSTATEEPEMDDVSVQTELFVLTEADVKPMIIVSRAGTPEPGAISPGEGAVARKGQRERWSLPADGHGLDFLREMEEAPAPPLVIRQRSVSMPAHRASYGPRSNSMKEAENVPAWMDKYYARGRSLSELPSLASSAGTTPPRPRRQGGLDPDIDSEGEESASHSGSSSRSMQRVQSAYFRPTISYMQKRNPAQRDSILARQASQTTLPRWS